MPDPEPQRCQSHGHIKKSGNQHDPVGWVYKHCGDESQTDDEARSGRGHDQKNLSIRTQAITVHEAWERSQRYCCIQNDPYEQKKISARKPELTHINTQPREWSIHLLRLQNSVVPRLHELTLWLLISLLASKASRTYVAEYRLAFTKSQFT